jgi:hypothetical protein
MHHAHRGIGLPVLLAILVIAGAIAAWAWTSNRPEDTFADMPPRAFIRPQDAGYDASKVIIARGLDAARSQIETPEGVAYPAMIHGDAQVVPQQDGKPYIFTFLPPTQEGAIDLVCPPLPPKNKPLSEAQLAGVKPYPVDGAAAAR